MEPKELIQVAPGQPVTPFTCFKLDNAIAPKPGMRLANAIRAENANGNVAEGSLAYDYTIQTTTAIRQEVIRQKFYEVSPAEFMPIVVGLGAWMEDIKTNLEYQVAGAFEGGYVSTAQSPSNLGNVDVATSPVDAKIWTWFKTFRYSIPEVNKALAFNNWNVIEGKMSALLKHAQLGLQKTSFLGNINDLTGTPGLLSNAAVTVNTAVITVAISSMNPTQFQALIQQMLAAYFANSNNTEMPDTFEIPIDDYLGLSTFVNPSFPMAGSMMIDVLEESFKKITGNANFRILPLLYGKASVNAGYWATNGTNRYALYRNAPDVLKLDMPVPYIMYPAVAVGSINFEGALGFQHTGCVAYRAAAMLYFDR